MKRKSIHKSKSKTRKYNMYGGVAPAPAFSGFQYPSTDLYTSLNNYLQAAYSIKLAADAIQDTSLSQNTPTTGTRNLQKNSAASFSMAAQTIESSLSRLYSAFSGRSINLAPIASGYPPYPPPPFTYPPAPWNPPL